MVYCRTEALGRIGIDYFRKLDQERRYKVTAKMRDE